jgi:hypothetical protein
MKMLTPNRVTTPQSSIDLTKQLFMKEYQIQKNLLAEEQENKINVVFSVGFLIFILLWILIGFAAFITSLVCFGRKGTMIEKIIGLLLAIFFGPFYFIFFFCAGDYCS